MSPLATLLATVSAIYGLFGAYYALLFARRRSQREYLWFGLMCLGLQGWCGATACIVDASEEVALLAARGQFLGGFVACASFVRFADRMASPASPSRLRWVSDAACLVGAVAFLGGVGLGAPMAGEPRLTFTGAALVALPLGLCGRGALNLLRLAARAQPDLRPFAVSAGLGVVATVVEMLLQLDGRSWHLVALVSMLPVLAISVALQARFLRAADELKARGAELRKSYSDLRLVQEELVRKEQLAAVGELSAVIAHEVRNPLAIIKNAVSSLRRPSLRLNDRRVLLAILDEEVDRLSRLVKNLLAYARPVAPRELPLQIGPLVEAAIDGARRHAETSEATRFAIDLARASPITGDPDLLESALTNVLANALQAMPDGGTVAVVGEDREVDGAPYLALELRDEGDGMESLVRRKATDPFFTTRASGTGLGLAIVERVVRNHGGWLDIESAEGEGTTVRLWLPRTGAAR